MGRIGNWGAEPLKRARQLIKFLLSYAVSTNHERSLYVEWRKQDSIRPELYVRTTLLDIAWLSGDKTGSKHDAKTKKEKGEIQNTIDRLKVLGIVVEDDSFSSEKSKGIRQLSFILWNINAAQENLNQLQLFWSNYSNCKKHSPGQNTVKTLSGELEQPNKDLAKETQESLNLYLDSCFRNDRLAKLDQAGEQEDENTKLVSVFTDLDARICQEIQPNGLKPEKFPSATRRMFSSTKNSTGEQHHLLADLLAEETSFSMMDCLLKEYYSKILIIGGPGQGKSTLGQQLAQIYRATLLNEKYDDRYQPETKRIPFHIVLREFAQWLASETEQGRLDIYLVERIKKQISREVSVRNIQDVLSTQPCILILDGLDEVVVPKLQRKMLECIDEFIGMAKRLEADLMVIATSRPSGYDNQFFEPENFLTIELDLLSPKKVTEYTEQWLEAKGLDMDKRSEILSLLKECQADSSISELLVTPLQVSIILIIIKDGRRPPSQREELFDHYWETIFRREESKNNKINTIIQNKKSESLLMHAYLGYLLHHKAAKQNVQSLLSSDDFKQAIFKFLKSKNHRLRDTETIAKIDQLVKEVGERLYMILQSQTGQYGFGLRSFQEFFAAVHLVQTANNTEQRFDRLKKMMSFEHWANVALFMAGRIARVHSGEVSNLQVSWRAVDRSKTALSNRFLRPGAWFALQIAADGSLVDTDIQYCAVEDGLKVLETGLAEKQQNLLRSLLNRLSQKDKQEILRPALEEKICHLPESCLINALSLYGYCFGATQMFLDKIDLLIKSSYENAVVDALEMALELKTDPLWTAGRLQASWLHGKTKFISLWSESNDDRKYFQKILTNLSLSEKQLTDLANQLLTDFSLLSRPRYQNRKPRWENLELKSTSDQILGILQCTDLVYYLSKRFRGKQIFSTKSDKALEISLAISDEIPKMDSSIKAFSESAKNLLRRSDLFLAFRVILQQLLWLIQNFDMKESEAFLEDFWNFQNGILDAVKNKKYWRHILHNPLLDTISYYQKREGFDVTKSLTPFLCRDNQITISKSVNQAIQSYLQQSNQEQKLSLLKAIRFKSELTALLPQLEPLASNMNIEVEEIVSAYVDQYSYGTDLFSESILSFIEDLLEDPEQLVENRAKLIEVLRCFK